MARVTKRAQIQASADAVWEVVSDFNALPRFVASIVDSRMEGEGIGALRTLTLADGSVCVETLKSIDHHGRSLTYAIARSPLPVESYVATMTVTPLEEGGCELTWASTFEPVGVEAAEARKLVRRIYSEGVKGLKRMLEG